MALILIFAGSFIGILVATIQMVFQDASFWQGLLTYLSFSFGFPLVTGVLSWSIGTLRRSAQDETGLGWHEA